MSEGKFDRPPQSSPDAEPPREHVYGDHRGPREMFGGGRQEAPRTEFHERKEAELRSSLQSLFDAHRGQPTLGAEALKYLSKSEFASDYISVGTSPDNQKLFVTIRTKEQGDLKVEL